MANTPTFTLRIPPELRSELERRAAADGRSLANYVARVLTRHVEAGLYPQTGDTLPALAEAPAKLARVKKV